MTLQTDAPLESMSLNGSIRRGDWFHTLREHDREDDRPEDDRHGNLELNAPYQRGDVWTEDQRRLLIKSFLLGVPVPSVVINDRHGADFRHADGGDDWRWAVVDGKQRVTTVIAWCDGRLDIPASWLNPDYIARTHETGDGPYVHRGDLTVTGLRCVQNDMTLLVATAKLSTLADEAALYLLLNRGGVAHTDTDLVAARNLADDAG